MASNGTCGEQMWSIRLPIYPRWSFEGYNRYGEADDNVPLSWVHAEAFRSLPFTPSISAASSPSRTVSPPKPIYLESTERARYVQRPTYSAVFVTLLVKCRPGHSFSSSSRARATPLYRVTSPCMGVSSYPRCILDEFDPLSCFLVFGLLAHVGPRFQDFLRDVQAATQSFQ
jgi:hypothetical protein